MISSKTMARRLQTLAAGLGIAVPNGQHIPTLIDLISRGFPAEDRASVWLALAVIRARFPLQDDFDTFWRSVSAEGAEPALRVLVTSWMRHVGARASVDVRIVRNAVLVDVHHTAQTGLATGIQRVARQTVQRWANNHDSEIVGWDDNFDGLRTLSDDERENALFGTRTDAAQPKHRTLIVPTASTYILPELAIEEFRTARLACMARESGNTTAVIGFDCVPLTSPETVGEGMGIAFARNLSAVAHFDRVSTISEAAGNEYAGWRRMLSGAGWNGPTIEPILLPSTAVDVTDEDIAEARETLKANDDPLVLCVGSHEPRKNHLALLYAAEVLWRQGVTFNLVFIGGNAWNSEAFRAQLTWLVQHGRPVVSISAISDSLLWSAYRLADVTIFPSLNEGFGLPVAESLAAGTPVITSEYGSMREIADNRETVDNRTVLPTSAATTAAPANGENVSIHEDDALTTDDGNHARAKAGGVLLVDPRNDDAIVRVLGAFLTDESLRADLTRAAAARVGQNWDDYAAELWDYFVTRPARTVSE